MRMPAPKEIKEFWQDIQAVSAGKNKLPQDVLFEELAVETLQDVQHQAMQKGWSTDKMNREFGIQFLTVWKHYVNVITGKVT